MMKRFAGGATVAIVIAVVVIIGVLLVFTSNFFYFFEQVSEQEVGIQLQSGKVEDIVGPGVYSDIGWYVRLDRISSQALPFSVTDEEIITLDKQRIGLTVSGDVFRPNVDQRDTIELNWAKYRNIYLDDGLAVSRVSDLARQSMKVCIGERRFDDAIIGNARDDLRNCIDVELNKLASNFGLTVQNVVVPEVILSPAVQAALDDIVP